MLARGREGRAIALQQYVAQLIADPLLNVVQDGRTIDPSRIAVAEFNGTGAADIIVSPSTHYPTPF